ncbi:related to GPI-anchor transamidase complex subunit Gpi16 [Sporisorium reilianum f. sp. reilianum]|uniref:Related to GPI-anchor transamidase complex subunit Gpi16 n=1 Tax=Sporisorium reilianum f. sp. reilianum TaxID=72559 RepID=A0A2N8UF12_9BASI|nr:related to GPI-anchor transamidase complex subunit Gpi16 [Sporisorium reilianum f. sp. reilianum]
MGQPTASSSTAMTSQPIPPLRWTKRQQHKRRWLPTVLLASLLVASTPALASDSAAANEFFPSESLHETLLLKPLPDGRVLSSFEFTLASTSASTSNFRLLPRTLLQPIQHFGVSEVHLSLNSGRWRYDSWGSPVTTLKRRSSYAEDEQRALATYGANVDVAGRVKVGEESVGSGAELWARFDQPQDATSESWKGLTSALAGLFCTSLDALDERHTVQPQHAYSFPQGGKASSSHTLHALLPTEGVCTENLTPFLKLLPCKNSAGLATLLNPLSLFRSNFHGLAVHVTRLQPATIHGEGGWQVKLTFTSVFAPAVTRDVSIRDWSISSLFERTLETTCPLADSSLVRILKPNDPDGSAKYQVDPLPPFPACSQPGDERSCRTSASSKGGYAHFPALEEVDEVTDELAASGLLAFETDHEAAEYQQRLSKRWAHYLDSADGEYLYDLPSMLASAGSGRLDVRMSWPHETRFAYPAAGNATAATKGQVRVERTLIGSGQERTLLQVVFTNDDARVPQRVLWYETLGYFVQPYLHTLQQSVDFVPSTSEDELLRSVSDYENPVEDVSYQPTVGQRGGRKPFVLESVVRIPAASRVTLTMELKKVFVAYSRHPPDAHRGFDLNPALVFPLAPIDPRAQLKHARSHPHPHPAAALVGSPSTTTVWNRLLRHISPSPLQPSPRERDVTISTHHTRIYTLPRLVELATPDFSFVYTNIIFTSTVIALFFGSALNTLLRTFTDFVL